MNYKPKPSSRSEDRKPKASEKERKRLDFASGASQSVEINYESLRSRRSQFEGEGFTVYDKSGKGNDGTLTNMDPTSDWVTGKYGYGLDFDGVDDYFRNKNKILIRTEFVQ